MHKNCLLSLIMDLHPLNRHLSSLNRLVILHLVQFAYFGGRKTRVFFYEAPNGPHVWTNRTRKVRSTAA